MNSDYVYSAVIDVLGYRNRLNQDLQNGTEEFKTDLESALQVLNTVNEAIFGVQAISDTIILTCRSHDKFIEFLKLIKKIFISFLERGSYIRGGIAYSRHFQSNRITYSHAIAKAYEIESTKAVYPRIVIDKNIIEMYSTSSGLPDIFKKDMILSKNGVAYLNILDESNWLSTRNYSEAIFLQNKQYLTEDEISYTKHEWFENFLFSSKFCDKSSSRYMPTHQDL